ncbi:hypothetical protein [Vibrio owensii]|uniref:hypothetical protein n=1 Tax=Vibrio owensii TaxID=696485 RepID=UPI00406949CF
MANPNWVKGMESPNPHGRKKGSRNKYTQAMLDTAMEHLLENDFNPMNEILKLYHSTNDEQLKARILFDYLKINNSVNLISMDEDGKAEMTTDEAGARILELLGKRGE